MSTVCLGTPRAMTAMPPMIIAGWILDGGPPLEPTGQGDERERRADGIRAPILVRCLQR